jgi:hypothetical protein
VRALAFVRSLLARWDRRVLSPLPLGLVVLRTPEPSAPLYALSSSWRADLHVHLRPLIELTLVRHGTTISTNVDASSRTTVLPHVGALVLRTATTERSERLLERTLGRGRRIETGASPQAPHAQVATYALHAQPSAAPLLTTLVTRREPPTTRADAIEAGPSAPLFQAPSRAAAVAEPPTLDVGRLTDQVLSAIDSRLVARAERLGRS